MTTAAMVGAGLIGRSWAMVFARAGWRVRLFDSVALQLDTAREHIASGLAEQQQYGLADDAAAAFARVEYIADLEQALAGVDWVQENAPEVLDVKRELYPRIDRATPKAAIVASSTSAIPASRFTETLAGRARCLVAHPVNPPHLVPVVELCGAPWTDAATLARARAVMIEIGQVPIIVKRRVDCGPGQPERAGSKMSSRCGAVVVEGAGAVKAGRQRGVDARAQRLQQVCWTRSTAHHPHLVEDAWRAGPALLRQLEVACANADELAVATVAHATADAEIITRLPGLGSFTGTGCSPRSASTEPFADALAQGLRRQRTGHPRQPQEPAPDAPRPRRRRRARRRAGAAAPPTASPRGSPSTWRRSRASDAGSWCEK